MNYTAHVRKTDGKKQSVLEHSTAVAENAQKYAEDVGASFIARIQGLIHDAGKMTQDFDDYINLKNNLSRGDIDHSFAGAKYIYEFAKETKDLKLIETAYFIARTVISHHGLHDWIDSNGDDYFQTRISKSERYTEIITNMKNMISDDTLLGFLEKAAEEYAAIKNNIYDICYKNKEIFALYMGLFERLMQSVLMDADRSDTADFMSDYLMIEKHDNSELWESMSKLMSEKCMDFRIRTDFISKQRTDISDRCCDFANKNVKICRLIVPTGGGKTLSSLRFAIEYCKKNKLNKIMYIAPFMSILEQNADEIRYFSGDNNLLEHYSNVIQEISSENELAEYELHADRWDKPVIATTLVQFLNTLFSGESASVRRMHRMCRSVIIVDEVQSVPAKCVHLFNMAINFLAYICGCTVVLCSATQPALEKTDYPIIFDADINMSGSYKEDFRIFKRTEIINLIRDKGYTFDETADFCYEKFLENGNLLLVVNTKKAAVNIFKLIKEKVTEEVEVIHISTNMCPAHRRLVLDNIRKLLKDGKPIICVTTQLIEAGVDISFKCAVRSLAGMDNAAQTAGRCNRNGENELSYVYIINICDENVTRLKEIKLAQDITRQITRMNANEDLLSVELMNKYFEKYYMEEKVLLSYPVEDITGKTNLIKMLSLNTERNFKKHNIPFCSQSFCTAGKLFNVIEQNTQDIIVPFNDDAKELIFQLNSGATPNELSEHLRKAQKYIVSVYPNTMGLLNKNGAVYMLECGAIILREGFYDDSFGINPESKVLDLLLYQ